MDHAYHAAPFKPPPGTPSVLPVSYTSQPQTTSATDYVCLLSDHLSAGTTTQSTRSLMSHRSSEPNMYTQQIICACIAFRATAGTAHERTPRTSHNPQLLSAFTYRPPAQQLTKHATTNLLTYPILVRYDTVVFDYSTTDGTAHLPRVLRPLPTGSFTHSALVQSYLHTT